MKSYNWPSPTIDIQHFSITLHDQLVTFSTKNDGHTYITVSIFYIYCPNWVKFGKINLHM